jgi:hypothetical protein
MIFKEINQAMTLYPFIRIDNLIVEKLEGGYAVGPIRLYERRHGVRLDLSTMPYVSTGSRQSDNLFIQRLLHSNHPMQWDDLPVVYPRYVLK